MDKKTIQQINQLKIANQELDRLYKKHLKLEKELKDLTSRVYLSPVDQQKAKIIKRKKLAGKDRIYQILADCSAEECFASQAA